MKRLTCGVCGRDMTKNGRTKAGTQRWRCPACGASATRRIDSRAKTLEAFVSWLMSKRTQAEAAGSASARTSGRNTEWCWSLWPLPPATGEVADVVFCDGIWIAKRTVVLVCCTSEAVLSWHVAEAETKKAWKEALSMVAAPALAVSDGAKGFLAAAEELWPFTRVQRCLWHESARPGRLAGARTQDPCGAGLLALAKALPRVSHAGQAAIWIEEYMDWRAR